MLMAGLWVPEAGCYFGYQDTFMESFIPPGIDW
ncbi:hypothetical protein ID866_10420 [Astraeus odoratus]|nr:hypothetical protein ID866_10420 [Astraeus odoratus]